MPPDIVSGRWWFSGFIQFTATCWLLLGYGCHQSPSTMVVRKQSTWQQTSGRGNIDLFPPLLRLPQTHPNSGPLPASRLSSGLSCIHSDGQICVFWRLFCLLPACSSCSVPNSSPTQHQFTGLYGQEEEHLWKELNKSATRSLFGYEHICCWRYFTPHSWEALRAEAIHCTF